jgi:predicted transcriptional regulator
MKTAKIKNNVRKYRQLQNLTIKELAEIAQMSERQIITLEHGEAEPRLSTVKRLMKPLKAEKAEDLFPSLTGETSPLENIS